MLTRILHTGVAVMSLKQAVGFFTNMGYEVVEEFEKEDIKAQVALVAKGESAFELFQFEDMDLPTVDLIRNHVAIYSDTLEVDIDALLQLGYELTIPITEGKTLRYAFVQDTHGTNWEIATDKTSSS
ncbi:MAG: VOC family protein [Patescibacteria group bacterium]